MKHPSPKADGLRAMREAAYAEEQQRRKMDAKTLAGAMEKAAARSDAAQDRKAARRAAKKRKRGASDSAP